MSWARWTSNSLVSEMLRELSGLLDTKESWEPVVIKEETDILGVPAKLHAVVAVYPRTPAQCSFSVSSGGVVSGMSVLWPLTTEAPIFGSNSPEGHGKVTMPTITIDLSTTLPIRLLRLVIESMKSLPDAASPRSTLGEVIHQQGPSPE